jgi:hypothetical protein
MTIQRRKSDAAAISWPFSMIPTETERPGVFSVAALIASAISAWSFESRGGFASAAHAADAASRLVTNNTIEPRAN